MSDLQVIKAYTVWCGPCKVYSPTFEEVANKNPDVLFKEVNIEKESEWAINNSIMSVPTTLFIKNNKVLEKIEGRLDKDELQEKVTKWK